MERAKERRYKPKQENRNNHTAIVSVVVIAMCVTEIRGSQYRLTASVAAHELKANMSRSKVTSKATHTIEYGFGEGIGGATATGTESSIVFRGHQSFLYKW
jgi:hypothetical protein